jgi:hypothetical protein
MDAVDVVVGRSSRGGVFSSFKSANGRTVRVLDRGVYRKASEAAGKALRGEIRAIREKAGVVNAPDAPSKAGVRNPKK